MQGVHLTVSRRDAGEDSVAGERGSWQRPDRGSTEYAAPDCQQVASPLLDRPLGWPRRSAAGRAPAAFPPDVVVAIKALACELPSRRGLPLAHWSVADLRREAVASGIVAEISGTTLWRWLGQDALRPWRHRSWLFPRDPQFARKAGRVIDLYQHRWKGAALGPRDYVLCIDEKTSIQARRRKHPSLPSAPGRAIYVEHEYARAGALAYLAAWDVHRARLFGRCERKNSIAAFHRLVGQIMRREPYRSARRVFLITDNGSCHRGRRAADCLHAKWASIVLVHTPVHASWLNQLEVYFSSFSGSC